MTNCKSAEKRNKQNEKIRLQNRSFRNRTRTLIKKALQTIDAGQVEEARTATQAATRDLDMLASKGIIHKQNAARRKSRLMQRLAQLESSAS